jgi:hypothetical protein
MFTSLRNELFLNLRSKLRFSRGGYCEVGTEDEEDTMIERELVRLYSFAAFKKGLSSLQWKRNLATLWLLNNFARWPEVFARWPDVALEGRAHFLEVGCQDFSRLPALKYFFKIQNRDVPIHGLEVDPFPVLSDLHSRWDRAQYYISLLGREPQNQSEYRSGCKSGGTQVRDQFFAGDFFTWSQKTKGLICFFPFVSAGPALSWGLPERFGEPQKWLEGIERCLEDQGFLFVVHQGLEEERIFDEARFQRASFLKLLERHELNCPFWLPKKPSCASLYVRDNGTG